MAAVLLLVMMAESASANEEPGTQSKNVRKVLATLEKFGINSAAVQSLVSAADAHVDKTGAMHLSDHDVLGGKLSFNYNVGAMPSGKQFELRYVPKDYENVNVVAHTNSIMLLYHHKFNYGK